jgi:hypothetical protein
VFPLWFTLFGSSSFVFLDLGPSNFVACILPSSFFSGCFGLYLIVRVSSKEPYRVVCRREGGVHPFLICSHVPIKRELFTCMHGRFLYS